jgi:LPS-assembly protein
MRGAALALLVLGAGAANAQSIPALGLKKAVTDILKQKPATETPTTGTPTQEAATGQLPEPDQAKGKEFRLVYADDAGQEGNEFIASGSVHVIYEGYDIYGDRVVFDKEANTAVVDGGARIVGRTEVIEAKWVKVNFNNRTFEFRDGRAVIKPERIQGDIASDVFVRGTRGSGSQENILTEGGSITTCDLEHPHYELVAGSTRVFPGRHALLKDVRLVVLGKTILRLPSLVIPLDRRPDKYLPEIGQSDDEGYYLKFKFATPLKGDSFIDHKVDLMSKLGIGLGSDYNYRFGKGEGHVNVYGLVGGPSDTLRASFEHLQHFGNDQLSLALNYNRFNYLTAPQTTALDARAMYSFDLAGGQTRLGWYRSSSESSGFQSVSQNFSLYDSRSLWTGFQSVLDVNMTKQSSSGFGSGFSSERVDVRYTGTQEMRSLTAELLYQRSIPVSSDSNFFSSSDRTPMLTIRSTADRMFGTTSRFAKALPWTAEMSVGELADPGSQEQLTRMYIDWGFHRMDGPERLKLNWGGRFKQGVYSDDTAQYTLNYDASLSWLFARDSRVNLNYRRLQSFGYTPLFMDRTGSSDAMNTDVTWQANKALKFAVQSGYDLLQIERGFTPWQSVSVRSEYSPNDNLKLSASSYYDTFNKVWSSARIDGDIRVGSMWFTLAARYDGVRSQWAGATLIARGLHSGKVGADLLFDYNGYTQQFDATQFAFTYDMHCADLVLEISDNRNGFRPGQQIALFVRIKAFPNQDLFGFGKRGQQIGGAGGFGY